MRTSGLDTFIPFRVILQHIQIQYLLESAKRNRHKDKEVEDKREKTNKHGGGGGEDAEVLI